MRRLFHGTGTVVVCLLSLTAVGSAQTRTPEDLISQVLKALESKDQQSLKAVSITADEVKNFVWPAVAVNLAGNGMNAEKFGIMYATSSDLGVSSALSEFGGRKWQLVKVAMNAPQKQSNAYRLFPAPLVTIRDEGGREKTVRLVGGILEQSGSYKVSTYYVSPGKQ